MSTITASFGPASFLHAIEYKLNYPHGAQEFAAKLHLATQDFCTTPSLPDISEIHSSSLLTTYTDACRNPYRSHLVANREHLRHFEGGLEIMSREIRRRMSS